MTDVELKAILSHSRTIAVVGASPDADRDSHRVARYLLAQGYQVVPVNPRAAAILGQTCYPSLSDIPFPIDVVDIFRAPDAIPAIVDEAIAVGAKVVWMQLGLRQEDAAARARAAGLTVVMDRCLKIEHQRLFPA